MLFAREINESNWFYLVLTLQTLIIAVLVLVLLYTVEFIYSQDTEPGKNNKNSVQVLVQRAGICPL